MAAPNDGPRFAQPATMMRCFITSIIALIAPACTDPTPTDPVKMGLIKLERWRDASGIYGGQLFGILADNSEVFGTPTATDGDCVYTEKQEISGWSMGDLTIEGTTALGQLTRIQGAYFGDGLQYPDGAELHVSASGGVLSSGFMATVQAPGSLENLAFPSALSRTTPAPIRWTSGMGDEVAIDLVFGSLGKDSAIHCRVTDTGEFAIPPTLLAMVSPTADGFTFYVVRRNVAQVSTPEAEIDVVAGDVLHSTVVSLEP